MPYLDKEKTVVLTKRDNTDVVLEEVTGIGPAEGFDDFVCFWKKDEELPFFLIPRERIESLTITTGEESDNS